MSLATKGNCEIASIDSRLPLAILSAITFSVSLLSKGILPISLR
jgi:hypothetical protein